LRHRDRIKQLGELLPELKNSLQQTYDASLIELCKIYEPVVSAHQLLSSTNPRELIEECPPLITKLKSIEVKENSGNR